MNSDEYSVNVVHAIEQLRSSVSLFDELPEVGGSAVGYAGEPHPTYILKEYIQRVGKLEDFQRMLRDKNPVVRIVGVQSLLSKKSFLFLEKELEEKYEETIDYDKYWSKELALRKEEIIKLENDQTEVFVGPYGCDFFKATVGSIVKEIIYNPGYFEGGAEPVAGGDATR